eukprot:m51a1_g1266 hypothetical protein (116) ;mRNA; f:79799-80330
MNLGFEQGSASWIKSHFSHMTVTDLGKILSVNTTCSRTKLLLSKINHTDLLKKAPPMTKKLMQNGKLFEESPIESIQCIPLRYYLQVQMYLNIMKWDIGQLGKGTQKGNSGRKRT